MFKHNLYILCFIIYNILLIIFCLKLKSYFIYFFRFTGMKILFLYINLLSGKSKIFKNLNGDLYFTFIFFNFDYIYVIIILFKVKVDQIKIIIDKNILLTRKIINNAKYYNIK